MDPYPDPTPFFSDLKDAKKNSHLFLVTYPQATIIGLEGSILLLKKGQIVVPYSTAI
jgi:hypothetical protein